MSAQYLLSSSPFSLAEMQHRLCRAYGAPPLHDRRLRRAPSVGDDPPLLFLRFTNGLTTAHTTSTPPPVPIDDKELKPEIKRFICNTISGELFRIPDIDGMKK